MPRHPSENYIKYLITSGHPQSDDDAWVTYGLSSLGYPTPDAEYLWWLRREIDSKRPANFQPQNRYHRESVKFLRSHGIWSIHNPDRTMHRANLIVTNLKARPLIEALLLGRVEPKEVAKKVNARLGEYFTSEEIEAYAHYYWNTGLLRVEDWMQIYSGEQNEAHRKQVLAIVQVGPAMALHKLGFQQAIESKTMLRETMEALYFDMREWRTMPISSSKTHALTAIARSMTMVDQALSQQDSALRESLKAFEKFRMQHANLTVPDMKQLAPAGNYTGSGAQLPEAHIPVEEAE